MLTAQEICTIISVNAMQISAIDKEYPVSPGFVAELMDIADVLNDIILDIKDIIGNGE